MDVPINRVYKIVMDQTIYFITKCSAYIALVGLLRGDSAEQVVTDVKERIWPVVFRGWRFWPLAHIVTYGFIPPRHRVLWVNVLDLVWSSILASLASADKTTTAAAPETPASDRLIEKESGKDERALVSCFTTAKKAEHDSGMTLAPLPPTSEALVSMNSMTPQTAKECIDAEEQKQQQEELVVGLSHSTYLEEKEFVNGSS